MLSSPWAPASEVAEITDLSPGPGFAFVSSFEVVTLRGRPLQGSLTAAARASVPQVSLPPQQPALQVGLIGSSTVLSLPEAVLSQPLSPPSG